MTNKKTTRPRLTCFLAALGILLCGFTPAALALPHRVLFISSYNPGFPTFFDQVEGMSRLFHQHRILLDIEFMDTKRFPSEENLHLFRRALTYKLSHIRAYDAIIAGDDNALKFALTEQSRLFRDLPIVFLGINDTSLALEQNLHPRVTGIAEKVSMKETLALMAKLHPGARRIVAIADPTTTAQADLRTFYAARASVPEISLAHLSLADMTFQTLGERLAELGKDTLVLLISAHQDREGIGLPFSESLQFINAHLPRPLYHLYYHGMGDGIVGGKLLSHVDQGKSAARMVIDILHGKPVSRLPVQTGIPNRYVFDYRQLQRFQVPLASLPANSTILYRPASFFRTYRQGIWVLVCLLALGGGVVVLLLSHLRQRLESEEALKKSEERFRSIIHFSPMGVLQYQLDASDDLVLTGVNAAARNILGEGLDSLVGKTIEEAFPKLIGTEVPEQFRRICSLGTSWHCPQISYEDFPIKGTYETRAFQTGSRKMACFFWDISERTRAEQALKEALDNARNARQQLEAILKSVSDGLLFTDLDNRIMLLSRSAEEMLGAALNDIFGLPIGQVIQNDVLLGGLHSVAFEDQEETSVTIGLPDNRDHKTRTVQANMAAVRNEEGLKRGVITLLRDISRERELDLMKTEFISTAAHELRTPLTSVIGFSEVLLKQGGFNEQQMEFLTIIHKKAEVLGKIVEDLLDLARVDSGQIIRLKKDWANIGSILERCVSDYRRACTDHHFKTVLPDETVSMLVDDRKLFQVMENLLSNAVKFSPSGSTVQITCQPMETEVHIAVSDQGIGMNPDQITRIFDKFYRVDASNTAREGLGLGMGIVRGIVEAHQGRIWVNSKPERGTTISFTLPRSTQE
ncbi:ATP-binding protein [Syntrophotalea acetylenica]|uniref:ATP-binding protein n=1 Tax=Syntrophotalea acetylenica TaxID=29542 RepID=UPI002A3719B2|nr:ATP-binding protein [Syntrophotalea acetylenica]MDY0262142.1 ATP-binding protein [Syntrophotalea acetylenica]